MSTQTLPLEHKSIDIYTLQTNKQTNKKMANSIDTFLVRFVSEDAREDAHKSLSELFVELHSSLARDFLKSYCGKKSTKDKGEEEVSKCQAKTAKGDDCPRKTCAESDELCAMHLKQSQKTVNTEKKLKAPMKEVSKCQAKTAKGDDCPRKTCAESDEFCATHLKQSQKPKVEKKPKESKPKESKAKKSKKEVKKIAAHNHELSEKVEESVAENCDLCQTHGNTLDPELTDQELECVSDDIQSRLQAILSNITDLDEDEAEESVAGTSKSNNEQEENDFEVDMPDIDFEEKEEEEDEEEDEEEEDI